MIEHSGPQLIRRYKQNYGIPDHIALTEELIQRHWSLERRLTSELLSADPAHRWEVFERCYTELYSELRWLTDLVGSEDTSGNAAADWSSFIGPPPRRVYEVGSGKGHLILALADRGYFCTATEITRERGEKWARPHERLRWKISDGVHLDRFEEPESYDAVISDQVIEHLHPADLVAHLRGAHAILRLGGRYAFMTPHAFGGPCDVSRVFGFDQPGGMHLKEYTYRELLTALHAAGFMRIEAAFRLPHSVRARFANRPRPVPSLAYLAYLRAMECIMAPLSGRVRRRAAGAMRLALWPRCIALVATKQ